ncbi:MAG: hypothetical protein U1C46_08330 [Bacteroidales bacterium]|nr:hypothetical protein [Bacteroidales bacterium]MDZ4204807.1 hypothetical protein [Bacteroidales bacterium]
MSRQEKQDQMLLLVQRWHQSGMSQALFSQSNGVKLCTLRYWIDKSRQKNDNSEEFIQINNPLSSGICLRYPNGVELLLSVQTPIGMLKGLVNLF